MDIKETLFALSNCDSVGNITNSADFCYALLSQYMTVKRLKNQSFVGFLKGNNDYTLMLDAHIDQIAMIVTDVDDKGFLTVAKSGGIDIRTLPARRVTVHGKEDITAVFCSTPPHLSSGEQKYEDISKIKLDTLLGNKAKDIISVGDYVTFNETAEELYGDKLCGRSFDNRAGAVTLLKVAEQLKDKTLPFNVAFLFSDMEELGLRGAKTSTFNINPDEAIVIDVSFGNGIGINPEESGVLGGGGMIGISPSLNRRISKKLINLAKENKIPYQIEALGENTGTNADAISVIANGVKTCTLSIPLRNMHTDSEIISVSDIENVSKILIEYILSGGVMND